MEIGTRVIVNGYPGVIIDNAYMDGMVTVRLASGEIILPGSEVFRA